MRAQDWILLVALAIALAWLALECAISWQVLAFDKWWRRR